MKQILVMMAAVVLVGCSKDTPEPSPANEKLIADPIVEERVRMALEKTEGKLTEADLEKVLWLYMDESQITDVGLKEVAKLQRLQELYLNNTQITDAGLKEVAKLQNLDILYLKNTKITDAGAAELKKALKYCEINGP